MAKLLLRAVGEGYSVRQNTGVLAVQLDGGASRYRRDILNGAFIAQVSWVCTAQQYDYFCAFYRAATASGSLPFEVNLVLDGGQASEFTAYFVPGTFVLARKNGTLLVAEAQLEVVRPFDPDQQDADEARIAAYEAAHGL